ncbi:MAG: DUF2497 domain-containing protein [Stellaceae bacterium]
MEEIIASISRIIAEDGRPSDPARRPSSAPKIGVLELTEAIAEDGSVRKLTPAGGPSRDAGPRREESATGAEPEPTQPFATTTSEPLGSSATRPGPILSAATSQAMATAFARLGAVSRERRAAADLPIGGPTRTLEDVVRASLQPLLQAWLEAHLPALVERLVREEIARVVTEAGLR